jgi:UDP-GlcNAc:undecaprenyl-phosphate GlcNAc-1-phosphate transferase
VTAGMAFLASLVLGPVVLLLLRHFQTFDQPCDRSSHLVATVRGGGLAPALAVVGSLLLYGSELAGGPLTAVLAGAALYGLLGFTDDLWDVAVVPRLAAQVAIAVVILPWLLVDLGGAYPWRLIFGAGVVLWLVAYVNAFNFMDGINGVAVAQVVVAGLCWWSLAQWQGADGLAEPAIVVAAAALGFLPYNFPRAQMFLGDVGSYFLGAWLAVVAIVGLRAGIAFEAILGPLALSLADTGTTLVRRLRNGDGWHDPHREHIYQQLHHRLGWSHAFATTVVASLAVACSMFGALSEIGPTGARVVGDVLLFGVVVAYLLLPRIVAAYARRYDRRDDSVHTVPERRLSGSVTLLEDGAGPPRRCGGVRRSTG